METKETNQGGKTMTTSTHYLDQVCAASWCSNRAGDIDDTLYPSPIGEVCAHCLVEIGHAVMEEGEVKR